MEMAEDEAVQSVRRFTGCYVFHFYHDMYKRVPIAAQNHPFPSGNKLLKHSL